MPIRLPVRRYLSFAELQERWQCSPNDIREAVLTRALVPSYFVDSTLAVGWWDWNVDPDVDGPGPNFRIDGPTARSLRVATRLFLRHPRETGTLDCTFGMLCDDATARADDDPSAMWFGLPGAITMADVEAEGVFMLAEIERFEARTYRRERAAEPDVPTEPDQAARFEVTALPDQMAEEREFRPQERKTMLKLIYAMAVAPPYSYDPAAAKNTAVVDIASATAAAGVPLSADTVRKYLREATEVVGTGSL